jgi:putative membrane protein
MKNRIMVIAAVAVSLTYVACQQKGERNTNRDAYDDTVVTTSTDTGVDRTAMNEPRTSDNDTEFLTEAYNDGMFEIKTAQLAEQKTNSPEVKSLAQKIIDDHTKANGRIKDIASKMNIMLPTEMDNKMNDHYNDFVEAANENKDFDKKYINAMVDDHTKAIKKFEERTKDSQNPDIQDFAIKTLPALTAHKAQANVIKEKMNY